MGIKGIILYRNKCQLQHLGDFIQISPFTVFRTVQCLELLILTGLFIHIVQVARFIQTIAVQINIHIMADVVFDIKRKSRHADASGGKTHQKQ